MSTELAWSTSVFLISQFAKSMVMTIGSSCRVSIARKSRSVKVISGMLRRDCRMAMCTLFDLSEVSLPGRTGCPSPTESSKDSINYCFLGIFTTWGAPFSWLAPTPSSFFPGSRTFALPTRTPSSGTAFLAPPELTSLCDIPLQVARLDQLLDFVLEGLTLSCDMAMAVMVPTVLTLVSMLGRCTPLRFLNKVGAQSLL